MILCSEKQWISFNIEENEQNVLVFEDKESLNYAMLDIYNQCNGLDGEYKLYQNELPVSFSKYSECILNPLLIDINSKKIINAIYKSVVLHAVENEIEMVSATNAEIIQTLDALLNKLPYPMEYNPDIDLNGLLKLYDVRIAEEESSVAGKIIDYISISSSACGTKLYFFVNIHEYLDEEELAEVYKAANYSKVNIISIEFRQFNKLKGERYHIIDKDKCLIEF